MADTVTMVRVYLTEGDARLKKLLTQLHDVEKVRGVTAFRGIAGFGASGKMHASSLLDMSLDLPVVVEFFDEPARIAAILEHLQDTIGHAHVVHWDAQVTTWQE